MPLNATTLVKSFHSLRKSLKADFAHPSPEQVHQVRTRARRLETVVALHSNQGLGGKTLFKVVAGVRKHAGKVRDMDVLLHFAAALSHTDDQDCLVQLLAYLGARRDKFASKLDSRIHDIRKQTRNALKKIENHLKKQLVGSMQETWEAETLESAQQARRLIADWPKLNARNLHPFRLQIKELIDVLKLMNSPNKALLHRLAVTKDAIGEWHDWTVLAAIASRVLDHRQCRIKRGIDTIMKKKLAHALALARRLRKQISSSREIVR